MTGPHAQAAAALDGPATPRELEQLALELATLAGHMIAESTTRSISVSYKVAGRGGRAPTDPVTEIDVAVEEAVRERLAHSYPGHGILGEESGLSGPADAEHVWLIDPVDGTQNFSNGVPFFGCAIGVVRDGVPVAGAVWCASTHALRPGVYHASEGGALHFDGDQVELPARPASGRMRAVSTAPMSSKGSNERWDHRSLGASVVECAFAAAGLLATARAGAPHAWDVAAAIPLAWSSGCEVWTRERAGWARFEAFPTEREALARWRQPLFVIGGAEVGRTGPPSE